MNQNRKWLRIAAERDVPEEGTLRVSLGREPICLYKLSGRIYATHDTCTHGDMSLADGFVVGENIECPLHQGQFHIPSGKACGMPCAEDLRTYETRVDAGEVYLRAEDDAPGNDLEVSA